MFLVKHNLFDDLFNKKDNVDYYNNQVSMYHRVYVNTF